MSNAHLPDEPVAWRLTDHVCRVCFGRVLKRMTDDRRLIVRCANCGTEIVDAHSPRDLCCCGLKPHAGRGAELRCVRNPDRSPTQPAELTVRFVDQRQSVRARAPRPAPDGQSALDLPPSPVVSPGCQLSAPVDGGCHPD